MSAFLVGDTSHSGAAETAWLVAERSGFVGFGETLLGGVGGTGRGRLVGQEPHEREGDHGQKHDV
jgi:hypothetical protein